MPYVSQNQSLFECPIVQELTEPVVVDVALLKHFVSQDKGWTHDVNGIWNGRSSWQSGENWPEKPCAIKG
ncbi:hypothetical protein PPACK8108_LOCUS434 [Phakopsora pachyrhizi]|uniref:Uncharacterized protein n=1 Tax=Phakopsora pachyrhizi TaxID=170000 RepID=A0AAV0ADM7_PHAPC|nr:hypothetical protein PPACK8108_LOCUS434 [Phakopsora pachyrhizi]